MDAALEPCPVCGAAARRLLETYDRNRLTTRERFRYDRCGSCRTVFLRTIPADLGRYYEAGYYQFGADGEPGWRSEPQRLAASAWRLALLARHVAPGHLIEIGAGSGPFSLPAKDAGFRVTAIEMSGACCEFLQRQQGITAVCSDDPVAALSGREPAAAIVLWHVLEHLADPGAMIAAAAERLLPGGVLALATPNPDSLQFRLLKARWMHLDAPRHLRLLAPETIAELGRRAGLRELERTSTDPNGRECDLLGWINALAAPPALGGTTWLRAQLGGLLWRLAAPLERSGGRGSAATLVLERA